MHCSSSEHRKGTGFCHELVHELPCSSRNSVRSFSAFVRKQNCSGISLVDPSPKCRTADSRLCAIIHEPQPLRQVLNHRALSESLPRALNPQASLARLPFFRFTCLSVLNRTQGSQPLLGKLTLVLVLTLILSSAVLAPAMSQTHADKFPISRSSRDCAQASGLFGITAA